MSKTNLEVIYQRRETVFHVIYQTPGRTGEIKLMMKFYLSRSLNFEICFLEFLWEIGFGVISRNYLYLKLLEIVNRTVVYLKSPLVQGFCPLKTEIARFPIRFSFPGEASSRTH